MNLKKWIQILYSNSNVIKYSIWAKVEEAPEHTLHLGCADVSAQQIRKTTWQSTVPLASNSMEFTSECGWTKRCKTPANTGTLYRYHFWPTSWALKTRMDRDHDPTDGSPELSRHQAHWCPMCGQQNIASVQFGHLMSSPNLLVTKIQGTCCKLLTVAAESLADCLHLHPKLHAQAGSGSTVMVMWEEVMKSKHLQICKQSQKIFTKHS